MESDEAASASGLIDNDVDNTTMTESDNVQSGNFSEARGKESRALVRHFPQGTKWPSQGLWG